MKTKLKKGVSMNAFLNEAEKCREEVVFKTSEGDMLNLKSTLTKFVFITVIGTDFLENAWIECAKADYEKHLEPYLELIPKV